MPHQTEVLGGAVQPGAPQGAARIIGQAPPRTCPAPSELTRGLFSLGSSTRTAGGRIWGLDPRERRQGGSITHLMGAVLGALGCCWEGAG